MAVAERQQWPEWVGAVRQPKRRAFLVAYSRTGSVSMAAARVGCDRDNHYIWLKADPAYAEAFQRAQELATDLLEEEARRRAYEGWDEPVYQKGELVGQIHKYSDTLLIFLLKGARPDKYRERLDVGSEPGRPLKIELSQHDAAAAQRLLAGLAEADDSIGGCD